MDKFKPTFVVKLFQHPIAKILDQNQATAEINKMAKLITC